MRTIMSKRTVIMTSDIYHNSHDPQKYLRKTFFLPQSFFLFQLKCIPQVMNVKNILIKE